jgi:hypothetical protein
MRPTYAVKYFPYNIEDIKLIWKYKKHGIKPLINWEN